MILISMEQIGDCIKGAISLAEDLLVFSVACLVQNINNVPKEAHDACLDKLLVLA